MRKFASTRFLVACATLVALSGSAPAEADLLSRVVHSIQHPKHHRVVHRKKRATRPAPTVAPESPSVQPVARSQASLPPLRSVAPSAPVAATQRKRTGEKLLAGIPVKDKPGFLRSPYTENQAVIDVRGFPSGTEVVDPTTGRAFGTP